MHKRRVAPVVAAWGVALAAGWATGAVPVEFVLGPGSGVAFDSFGVTGQTSGWLIGNWDPESNPGGTRTKPGIFGSFGATENVAVPTEVDLIAGGTPATGLTGGLRMDLDPGAGVAEVAGLSAMGVGEGAVGLSARVVFQAFRTRSPTSTFPGGVPVTLPLGSGVLRELLVVQVGRGLGTLSELGADRDALAVPLLVELTGVVEALGNVLPFGPLVVPLGLVGEVSLDGTGGATLAGGGGIAVSTAQPVDVELPALPFGLPTVLPPGDVANVVFTLTLEQVAAALAGQLTLQAGGVVVPEPGGVAGSGGLAAGVLLGRRRR